MFPQCSFSYFSVYCMDVVQQVRHLYPETGSAGSILLSLYTYNVQFCRYMPSGGRRRRRKLVLLAITKYEILIKVKAASKKKKE